jgi:hypothetical protein
LVAQPLIWGGWGAGSNENRAELGNKYFVKFLPRRAVNNPEIFHGRNFLEFPVSYKSQIKSIGIYEK